MDLFRELLRARNGTCASLCDACKAKEVLAVKLLSRTKGHVAEADVKAESSEDPPVDGGHDGEGCTAVGSPSDVSTPRRDREQEVVAEVNLRGSEEGSVCGLASRASRRFSARHGQIEVSGGARFRSKTQFHRVSAFQEPTWIVS